jgi:hypothetical protein
LPSRETRNEGNGKSQKYLYSGPPHFPPFFFSHSTLNASNAAASPGAPSFSVANAPSGPSSSAAMSRGSDPEEIFLANSSLGAVTLSARSRKRGAAASSE